MANPFEPIEYATIVGRFMVASTDSDDLGDESDMVAATGKGRFLPSVSHILVAGATPPATIKLAPIDFEFDEQGYISNPITKERGVRVVAPTDAVNPTGFTYRVTFDAGTSFLGFDFSVPAGGTVDLTRVGRVARDGGVPITRGEPGVGVAAIVLADDEASLQITYDNGLVRVVPVPALDEARVARDEAVEAATNAVAPTQAAIAQALVDPDSEARAALNATYVTAIKPEQFGAVGDGVADDTAAVRAAFEAANAQKAVGIGGNIFKPGATVVLSPDATYNLATLSVPIDAECNVSGAGATLVAPKTYGGIALRVGNSVSGRVLHNAKMELPNVIKINPTEHVPGSIGVQVINLTHSTLVFGRTVYFETAQDYNGLGQGTVYNDIFIGWIDMCKVALRFVPMLNGWVNQNTFRGGGITQSPVFGSSKRRPGWRHLVMDQGDTTWTVNANTFIGTSFEGDLSEAHLDLRYATNNTFIGCRFEQGSVHQDVTNVDGAVLTSPAHGLTVGDMVIFLQTGAAIPGFRGGKWTYYVSATPTADTFSVSEVKGGVTATFGTAAGVNYAYYRPPVILLDGDGGNCHNNEIRNYYAYPGPLDVRRVNAPRENVIVPATARNGERPMATNLVMNGNFRTNQRGYVSGTATVTGDSITFDRWRSATAGVSLAFTPAPQGQTVTVAGGGIFQVIERANITPGPHTLSWHGTARARIYPAGTVAPAGSVTSPATVVLDGTTDMVVQLTDGTAREVQLEAGWDATPYMQPDAATELAQCRRYFQRFGAAVGATVRDPLGVGVAFSATAVWLPLRFSPAMRATPLLGVAVPEGLRLVGAGSVAYASTVAAAPVSATSARLTLTSAGLTAGASYFVDTGDANTTLDFIAEPAA